MNFWLSFSDSTPFNLDSTTGQLTYTGDESEYGCHALTVIVRNEEVLHETLQDDGDWYQQVSLNRNKINSMLTLHLRKSTFTLHEMRRTWRILISCWAHVRAVHCSALNLPIFNSQWLPFSLASQSSSSSLLLYWSSSKCPRTRRGRISRVELIHLYDCRLLRCRWKKKKSAPHAKRTKSGHLLSSTTQDGTLDSRNDFEGDWTRPQVSLIPK